MEQSRMTNLNNSFLQALRDEEAVDEDVIKAVRRTLKAYNIFVVDANYIAEHEEAKQTIQSLRNDLDLSFDPWCWF
jgi:hypothetical protein